MTTSPPLLPNSSFSTLTPGLQLAVDSTSLGEFKSCPRKYYYSIVMGYQPRQQSVHLQFGILLHSSVERYHHWRAKGTGHEEGVLEALRWVLCETWDAGLKRPWLSGHPTKNRLTLVQTLVGYLDKYGENDPLETIILSNGKPAVELSFKINLGVFSEAGEEYLLCGHLDRLATLNGTPYDVDVKTTGHSLDASYFAQYSPDNQISIYTAACQIGWSVPVKGVILDACQVLVGGTRFERQIIPRTAETLDEWLRGLSWWLASMEQSAEAGHWPQNDKACQMYGGCQFRPVCSRAPSARQQWLDADYRRRVWDPLIARGDV